MKILIVSNGFPPTAFGGVEVYSLDLARDLVRRGHSVKVFCREMAPQRADYETWSETVEGIPVVRVVNDFKEVNTFRRLYADPLVDQIFARLLDEFKPDLVHFNHFLALSATLPNETKKRRIPSVVTLHDYWTICQRVNLLKSDGTICSGPHQGGDCYRCMFVNVGGSGKWLRWVKKMVPYNLRVLLRRLLRRPGEARILFSASPADFSEREQVFQQALSQVDRHIVPSQFVRQILSENGYPAKDVQVIPLGISFAPLPRERHNRSILHIGFVGSVIPTKGVESLIKAFRQVPGEHVQLDIYGREDVQPLFSRHLHDLAEGDARIVFHGGFSPDQREAIFSQLDVFVMPSIWHETFSFVAREALQAGIPVIAARVGALTEIIQEGVNGYLYPHGNVQALSAVLCRIAENPQSLDTLQIPGPVEILSVTQHVDRIEQVYTQVVAQ